MSKKQNLFIFMVFMVKYLFLTDAAVARDAGGEIRGAFFENADPCSLRINIHNAITGLYFGKTETDSNGIFVFSDLPYGTYYLITHPADVGVRMPLLWKTDSLEISEERPQNVVRKVDGFATQIIYPQDSESIDLEKVTEQNPLIFQWKPYCDTAEYEVEIYSTDKTQYFKSGRIESPSYSFNGLFPDGSHFRKRLYRWELKVYPEGTEWVGTSKPQDLVIGDLGVIKCYEGEYIQLQFPKWYESTIDSLDLLRVLDTCYLLERELAAGQVPTLGPLPGEKQAFLYDPAITFAYSGNPIHFGKTLLKENNFPFFLSFHEVGHNFQFGGLPGFAYLLGDDNYQRTSLTFGFAEGLATLASLYITERIDKEVLKPSVQKLFEEEKKSMREKFGTALDFYEDQELDWTRITPDIIDGMCLRLGDRYGWEKFPVFFRIFLKSDVNDQILNLAGGDDTKRTTIFIAAFSVAVDDDLREQFRKWNIPLDDQYYQAILPLVGKSLKTS